MRMCVCVNKIKYIFVYKLVYNEPSTDLSMMKILILLGDL